MTGFTAPVSRTGSAIVAVTGRRGLCMGFAVSEGLPGWGTTGQLRRRCSGSLRLGKLGISGPAQPWCAVLAAAFGRRRRRPHTGEVS